MDYYVVDRLTCMFCMQDHSCISLFLVALKLCNERTAGCIDANAFIFIRNIQGNRNMDGTICSATIEKEPNQLHFVILIRQQCTHCFIFEASTIALKRIFPTERFPLSAFLMEIGR